MQVRRRAVPGGLLAAGSGRGVEAVGWPSRTVTWSTIADLALERDRQGRHIQLGQAQ